MGAVPEAGLSDREIVKRAGSLDLKWPSSPAALARGDITVIREELDELLDAFQLNVDRKSASYRKLGMAVLTAHARALKDIERRNTGEAVETPPSAYAELNAPMGEQGGTLREAFEGWKKERERPDGTCMNTVGPSRCLSGCTGISPSWKSSARTRARFAKRCR